MSESSSLPSPRPTPQRMPRITCGACDMDSMPPGQRDLRLAELNHLRGAHDGLHARAAQPVHGQRRHFDGNTGFERHVTRAVKSIS